MAIAYSPTGITITDDRNPSRPPLVLPATATPTEVESAAAGYLQPVPAEPDYVGFYSGLLDSLTYRSVVLMPATAELARALAIFVSAMQDAMAGRVNPGAMQGAIWLLLGQVALTEAHAAELSGLMTTHHLSGTYLLSPPAPERARDAGGQFVADDPATPDVNEAWA
jgi:hypothetical protein